MAFSTNDINARRALDGLNATVSSKVKKNLQLVTDFNEKLQGEIQRMGQSFPPFHGATLMHAGSAYEGLAVEEKADFDVLVILGGPYIAKNFIVRRDHSGYFILRWNATEGHIGRDLEAAALQCEVLDRIKDCVRRVILKNASISSLESGLAAVHVTIAEGWKSISIDLAPQIVSRTWDNCPGIKPLSELPRALSQHIEDLQRCCSPIFFFTPAIPNSCPTANHRWLFDVAFSQLEKKFIVSSEVRDVVRLAKLVAFRRGWKICSLKSFHLKRVAIKHYNNLGNQDLRSRCKALLTFLSEELNGGIDGYFLRNQIIYHGSEAKRRQLRRDIANALTNETLLS